MCYTTGDGAMCATGTSLYIDEHSKLGDGRMVLNSIGQRRFRVKEVVRERPVLVCEVEWLDPIDPAPESPEVEALGKEVAELVCDVLNLNLKLDRVDEKGSAMFKKEITGKGARSVSFIAATLFADSQPEQQFLLEMGSTEERLKREKEVFDETRKWLTAQISLKSVFGDSEASGQERGQQGPTKGGLGSEQD